MIWPLGLVVLLVGVATGPALDRLAAWSLTGSGDRDGSGCDQPETPWRRRPLVTGLMAGCFGAGATWLVPDIALVPAWVALALVGAVITRTDLARHRIPNSLNAVAFAAGAVLLLIPADAGSYGRAWLAGLAVTAGLLGLALIGPTGLGMGDVKLGPTLGLYLGFLGWDAVIVGVFAGFVLGACAGLTLVVRQAARRDGVRAALRRALPFGPFLIAGTLVGLAL